MEEHKKEKIDFSYNLKTYWNFLKKYKWLFLLVLFIVLINETNAVIDKFLFKVVIDKGTLYEAGTLSKELFIPILGYVAVAFGVLILFKMIIKWVNLHLINLLESNLIRDLKQKYFNHILHLSHGFHTSHKTGSLISRLTRGGGSMERMTDVIAFNAAPMVFELAIVSLSIIYFSGITALVVLLTVIAFIGYGLFIQQVQRPAGIEQTRVEDIEKGNIGDIFTNIDSVKYFGKENTVKAKFANLIENTKRATMKSWGFFRWLDAGQSLILGVGTFFIIYFPLIEFLDKQITLGSLVFIYTVYLSLLPPMYGFVHGMRNYYRSMTDFNDLFEYGKYTNDIKDTAGAKKLSIKEGKVEFEDISFSYNKKKVISNLTLKIAPGEKVALVGHSGCGKTTLVKLLYRFYDVDSGNILVDHNNIKDVQQESLRSQLSIVPQECILFDDTIYNNIAFSNPAASRAEVFKAMKFAQLDKFVADLPKKEDTIVGERGVKLSGGEKQRVSIARAILANRKVLVLDEATSALDSETEHEIQGDLERLMKGRTSIIIAHRLSTIMKADRIIVMEKGKIVQIGTHAQLINKVGQYKKLWELQKGGYLKE